MHLLLDKRVLLSRQRKEGIRCKVIHVPARDQRKLFTYMRVADKVSQAHNIAITGLYSCSGKMGSVMYTKGPAKSGPKNSCALSEDDIQNVMGSRAIIPCIFIFVL